MTYKDYMLKKHRELTEQISQANHDYYIKDSPTLSDAEYDRLLLELERVERDNPELATENSPTQTVGHTVTRTGFKKVRHRTPMLSLDKVHDSQGILDWCNSIEKEILKR